MLIAYSSEDIVGLTRRDSVDFIVISTTRGVPVCLAVDADGMVVVKTAADSGFTELLKQMGLEHEQ